jgi:amino acid transporter
MIPHIVDNTTMDTAPGLRRALHLRHLIFMGLIIIQPTAPMPLFGVVSNKAGGHVASTILAAMAGMLLTAISYGRMARLYPSAGSAYTYVGKEIHPTLGFLTGWGLLLDYVINPLICVIWCAKAAGNLVPAVPYLAWTVFFAILFTWLNLRNIQAAASTHKYLAIAMGVVVAWMLAATAKFLQTHPADPWKPFYDPATFSVSTFSAGTALAVLTYIGFDAISTLSEETVDAENTIPKATVLVCLLIGVLSALEVYAGQLVWPHGEPFPDVDTAYVHIAGRAGGPWLFHAVNLTLLVATIGSGSGGQMAGARLLYGMGRDNVLPPVFFARIDAARQVPARNVMLIGTIALGGAMVLTYELGAELLNFGAFIGFLGVNLAAFLRACREKSASALAPAAGFLLCLYMWASLSPKSLLLGGSWAALGLAYRLLRKTPALS